MNEIEETKMSKIDETENESDVWNKGKITKKGFDILRKTLVPSNAKQEDIELFLYLSKRYELDPFNREIFLIPYKNRITVTTSRDGYLKIAHRDPNFLGLVSMEVYEGDEFWINETGNVHHKLMWTSTDIKGAWATAFHKNRMPFTVFVRFDEYNKGTDIWVQYPAAMIKKVAEATVLRRQFDITIPNVDELNDVDDGKHTARDFEQYVDEKHKHTIDIPVDDTPVVTPAPTITNTKHAEHVKSIEKPIEKPIDIDTVQKDFVDATEIQSNNTIITKINSVIDSIIHDQKELKKQPYTFRIVLKQITGSIMTSNIIRSTTKTNTEEPDFLIEIQDTDGNINIYLTVIHEGNKGTIANKDVDVIISDLLSYTSMFNNQFFDKYEQKQKQKQQEQEQEQKQLVNTAKPVESVKVAQTPETKVANTNTDNPTNLITPKQIKYVQFMLSQLKKDKSEYGIGEIETLTKSEAKELIDILKKQKP